MEQRPHLEPIQEESEQEDEIRGGETGEGQEEDFQIQVGVEAKEAMTEESEEDEDADLLRVLRPRRLSHSLSGKSIPQMQSANNHQEEMENFSLSDWSSRAVDLSDEASLPGQARLGSERSRSDELRIKVSKIRWQKIKPFKPSVQKKTNSRRQKKASLVEEPFPKWLVNLMINIDEAVTHELVVE
ncbi:hypothetical protein L3Q82_021442 [Scortum barcoo]|uniref:Uncharacterized protein n=1 Tax=Scortum barcoo TaxID=214431 RepID=A0ACB8X3R0_9TELE|nr:hypothetical protein L3Q82_021442 [Scortum barcoo]